MQATLVKNKRLGLYAHLTLRAPGLARTAQPGQFVEVRTQGENAPFWRRPFSICRCGQGHVELLVKTIGTGSRLLGNTPVGANVDLIGPLGKGFDLTAPGTWVLAGGGYGIVPLLFLAERLKARRRRVDVLIGGRCGADLLLRREFKLLGASVACATEDGSVGRRGLVTELLRQQLLRNPKPAGLAACGPRPMLAAVAGLAKELNVPAQVSLEEMMACGLGVCNGCVVKAAGKFQRVCADGPVFAAQDVDWHDN